MYTTKLKDGTIIEIENNGYENEINTIMSNLTPLNDLIPKMTMDNLSTIQKFNDHNLMYCELVNMKLDSVVIKPVGPNYSVTFMISKVANEELMDNRITELEKNQKIQNDAIADMSESLYV